MMQAISGVVINEEGMLTFEEIRSATHVEDALLMQFIEYHIVQPLEGNTKQNWVFNDLALKRAKLARNFYHDLEVNMAGVGLLLDLLERIEALEVEVEKYR